MNNSQTVQFWGHDGLRRWSEAALRHVPIPEASKSYLVEVGLPREESWTLRFDGQADDLPELPAKPGYRVIGFDDVVPLCIDEGGNGRVLAVEPPGDRVRYINEDVQRFGECLVYYQQYRISVRDASEDDAQVIIESTEKKMRAADATAFATLDRWWPLIIEQMQQGLL